MKQLMLCLLFIILIGCNSQNGSSNEYNMNNLSQVEDPLYDDDDELPQPDWIEFQNDNANQQQTFINEDELSQAEWLELQEDNFNNEQNTDDCPAVYSENECESFHEYYESGDGQNEPTESVNQKNLGESIVDLTGEKYKQISYSHNENTSVTAFAEDSFLQTLPSGSLIDKRTSFLGNYIHSHPLDAYWSRFAINVYKPVENIMYQYTVDATVVVVDPNDYYIENLGHKYTMIMPDEDNINSYYNNWTLVDDLYR